MTITCFPKVSFCIVKLIQISTYPAAAHHTAAKHAFKLLLQTLNYGLKYWSISSQPTLPAHPFTMITQHTNHHQFHYVSDSFESFSSFSFFRCADSDWTMKNLTCLLQATLGKMASCLYNMFHRSLSPSFIQTFAQFFFFSHDACYKTPPINHDTLISATILLCLG